jgi:hypothetical protein
MSRYLLHHEHQPHECGAVFASFAGHDSPMRHRTTMASCLFGGHAIWWEVQTDSADAALELLPLYVAERTTAVPIAPVDFP